MVLLPEKTDLQMSSASFESNSIIDKLKMQIMLGIWQ